MPLVIIAKGIFFVLLVLSSHNTNAQLWDSIGHHVKHPPKLHARLSGRSSFISGFPAKLFGVQLGLTFNDRVRTGIGVNGLRRPYEYSVMIEGEPTPYSFQLYTCLPYFEYTFVRRKRWEAMVNVQLGFGRASVQQMGAIASKHTLLIYEPNMIGLYHPLPWISVGGGIGYSITAPGKRRLGQQLTAPIYLVKLGIDAIYLWQQLGRTD